MWTKLPLVTKAPFLMVFAQFTIVKDRQTDRQTNEQNWITCYTDLLLDRKIDRKKAKITFKKTSRFKIVVVTADPMTLIKQQKFSTNKINSFCVTACCQIIIVPLEASSLFNWAEILAMS